ncbi:helix-turn-helix transcriptional regulator [Amycolatopsis sp. H20-H5]|uniref:helix-turn-helix transcriptional regulator n=1 Tax=Amycolatopsis sp. H20-H5 TaxID=3046309 RepID=UPI002DB8BD7C|nr:helix-turn-helix transcriptional regulator [Amycolatopsis sp. H20-H5]MEC3979038.1 helix-turn-helix transcriptional regulator [Amycolatopsis sp. H20-H5]
MPENPAPSCIPTTSGQVRPPYIAHGVDDELVVHVYEYTLTQGPATISQAADVLRLPPDDVKQAMGLLRDLRLLQYSEAYDCFQAMSPDAAQNELVIPLQQAVNDKRRELASIHERLNTLSDIFSTLRRSHQNTDKVVSLLDPQQAWLHMTDVLHNSSSEVLAMQSFDRRPSESFLPTELPMPLSGMPIRLVCAHSARASTITRARLRRMTDLGAQVRTSNHIFDNLVLVGDDVAFLPHQASDEDIPSVIAVYEPMIIALLHRLYEYVWQSGTDFATDAVSYGETLTDLKAGILNLLARGLKDDVVARRVGVCSRTLRRHISTIMDELGAANRFQAGVAAARAGLIES